MNWILEIIRENYKFALQINVLTNLNISEKLQCCEFTSDAGTVFGSELARFLGLYSSLLLRSTRLALPETE